MDVQPSSNEEANTPFNPLAGWEAATRWNASAFDLVAKAWQQWLALVTTVPATYVARVPTRSTAGNPSPATASRVRTTQALHAAAQAEPRRPARARGKASKRTRG